MPQILWIGCLESDEEFRIKAKKGYNLASAQVSQKNLLSGIEEVSGIICDSINGSVLPPYPQYKDYIIKPIKWEHKPGANDISVGYKNGNYINRVNCKNAMLRAADAWCDNRYEGGELIVFAYSMRSAPMATVCRIKKRIPETKSFLIVTDLPQFMDLGQNKVKAFLKRIDWKNIKKMQKIFAGFILYSEEMAKFLKIPREKWILMEGSYNCMEKMATEKANKKKKAIMYSGKLEEKYGIKMLIDAFSKVEGDYELWITGSGRAEDYVREKAEQNDRIKFYGFLPERIDVLKKQVEADLLVNMRLPSEPSSAYCFPSKLFEYMGSGTPVISFDIGGIPREYFPYLYIVREETVDALADGMRDAMEAADRENRGGRAKKFIETQKTAVKQCEKIWTFVLMQ